jgi:lipopolysaccharide biosynthesis regulator YciM
MPQTGKEREHEKAISALLSSNTIEAAAKKAGISKRTLCRWLDTPEFAEAYRKAKADTLKTATAVLTRNSARAAVTLGQIFLSKGKENQSSRVSAARATLKLAIDSLLFEDIDLRLRKLERQKSDF